QGLPFSLTPRELEVLRMLVECPSRRQLAQRLYISPRTLDKHLTSTYAKLAVSTGTAAVALALRQGLFEAPPQDPA
ncbi:MAG TPA: LuxR C-terminal-related transcriptional regulator, partial [Dehalococcoidia bacterium]|nr:LuxR C-terminal-related transcriptional regulator [Dehalococcoidia bacterium]